MEVVIRRGTMEDARETFDIFLEAFNDLADRTGVIGITGGDDPAVMATLWESRRSAVEHLINTVDLFWVAERDGRIIGFANTILRDDVWQLTQFFVRPNSQSGGVGKELLDRALPRDVDRPRVIVATTDARALARYLKAGVYPRFPVYYFEKEIASAQQVETDLTITPVTGELEALASLDRVVLGYSRDVDHGFLQRERQAQLYRRDGAVVGYGYTGARNGPFALLDASDFPAALAHAESLAAARDDGFGVEAPLINQVAVDYLLARGFKMDAFFANFMSDRPLGKYENYIFTSPPWFS